ncbi:MAG: preprotein translocase subunit SecY [Candidatus Paceibacterota bacterium]
MNTLVQRLKTAFADETLRKRILFVFGALLAFRVLAVVPIPSIDALRLQEFFANNQFLGLLNIFSGGGLSNLSIVMLGVGPYITAAIIMQLLSAMVPKIKAMYHEEGQAGRQKFTQYSRLLTIPLGTLQAFGFLMLLQRQGVIGMLSPVEFATNVIVITAGAVFLMWIGELISEFGIGNGVSLLIFAGIIAQLPSAISQLLFTYDPTMLPTYIGFLAAAAIIVFGIVYVNEAERPIPITYAKQARGFRKQQGDTHLPLRVNQAGVMPIIFALSILLFPQMMINFFAGPQTTGGIVGFILGVMENMWIYGAIYFILVFLFTYFYTAITFEVESVAENLQKTGAFIPGVRPGQTTIEYISTILTRITFIGGVFLGLIAILPIIMQAITGLQTLAIGGTALLIVVAVVVDFVKRLDAQIAMREY